MKKQLGLSLIELMVALAIGIFLLAGIIQVTMGSRQSFEVIHANASMQEAARFGMNFIASTARQAGYINAGSINFADGDEYAYEIVRINDFEDEYAGYWPAQNGFLASAVVQGTDTASAAIATAKAGTDSFTFRLQGDPYATMQDCEGRQLSTNRADIIRITYFVDTADNLNCDTQGTAADTGPVQLVTGVEDLQILYGVADPATPNRVVKYIPAATVDANAEWQLVMAVRIGLLTVSDNAPLDQTARTYNVLDKQVADVVDGNARQVFAQTIALRNKMID